MSKGSFFTNKRKPLDIVTDASELLVENSERVIRKSMKLLDDSESPLNPSSLKRSFFEKPLLRRQEITTIFSEKSPSSDPLPEVYSMDLSLNENFDIDVHGGSAPAALGILFSASHADSIEKQSSNAMMARTYSNKSENCHPAATEGLESQPLSINDSSTTTITETTLEHTGLLFRPESDSLQQQDNPAAPSPMEKIKIPHHSSHCYQQPHLQAVILLNP